MIRSLVKAGLRARLMLFVAVATMSLISASGRLGSPNFEWDGGTLQGVIWILFGAMVLPTIVAMLATHTFAGEHSTWSWALARPLDRKRVFRTLLVMDAATIGACIAVTRVLIGIPPKVHVFLPSVQVNGVLALSFALGTLYLCTAAVAATGRRFLQSAALGSIWALIVLAAPATILAAALFALEPFVRMSWVMLTLADALGGVQPGEMGPVVAVVLAWVGFLALPVIATSVPFVRVLRTLPLAPSWRTVLGPAAATAGLYAGICAVVGLALIAAAPDEARTGDRTLQLEIELPGHAKTSPSIRVWPTTVDRGWANTMRIGSREYWTPGANRLRSVTKDLHPGSYEVCQTFFVRRPTPDGEHEPLGFFETCEPVEVTDAANPQVVRVSFDPTKATNKQDYAFLHGEAASPFRGI